MSTITTIGFIGLGNIGRPMAAHLLTSTFKVSVYDVVESACEALAENGATVAASPAELAHCCQYIGLCVRDHLDIEQLLYGQEGLLANAQHDTVIAIHSTVTQERILQWAHDAKAHGINLLDAPMTGGASGAEAGALCYMVGGEVALINRIRPVLETSAEKIIHTGPLGTGIALKLCNNLITYAEFTAMSEAVRLADACGLDIETLREVGKSNGVVNEQMYQFITNRNAIAASCTEQDMEQLFGPFGQLGKKDLQCALETASHFGIRLPATEEIRSMIEAVFLNHA